jgi:hypothetical protein
MRLDLYNSDSLNFVEFNTTGDKETYVRCDEESKYLDTTVFNIFIDCFEKSHKLYDYIEPTQYSSRRIIPLLNELKRKEKELMAIKTVNDFSYYIENLFLGKEFLALLSKQDPTWDNKWKYYLEKLLNINTDLIALTEKCIDEVRVLWILGY